MNLFPIVGSLRRLLPVAACLALLLFSLCSRAQVEAERPWDILAHGSSQELWYAVTTPAGASKAPHTFVWVRPWQGDWQASADIPDRLIAMGDLRGQLVVSLESGELKRVVDAEVTSGTPLPGRGQILAFAGQGDVLWAVGFGEGARPEAATRTSAATGPAIATRPSVTSTGPTTRPEQLQLYKLTGGKWVRAALLPYNVNCTHGRELSLAILRNSPALLYREIESPSSARLLLFSADNGAWIDAGSMQLGSGEAIRKVSLMTVASAPDRPVAWAVANKGVGSFFLPSSLPTTGPSTQPVAAVSWREKVLSVPADVKIGDVIAVSFKDELRLLVTGRDERFYEQKYDAAGNDQHALAELPAPRGDADSNFRELIRYGLLAGLLVLTLVSASRGGAIAVATLGKTEVAVAPLGVRLAAGLIDLCPIYVAMLLVYHHEGHAKLSNIYSSPFDLWVVGIATIIYVLHPLACELVWGRSVGKMFVGLRVISRVDGQRPPVQAIVLRNLMRPIELFMFIPLLIIAFNPLRQRLGDLTAATLVATKLPPKGERERERMDEE